MFRVCRDEHRLVSPCEGWRSTRRDRLAPTPSCRLLSAGRPGPARGSAVRSRPAWASPGLPVRGIRTRPRLGRRSCSMARLRRAWTWRPARLPLQCRLTPPLGGRLMGLSRVSPLVRVPPPSESTAVERAARESVDDDPAV